ncbi:MAG: hypothetical protein ACKODX_22015 [Gemmata sp.]
MPTRLTLAVCALGLLFAAGCGPAKLSESKTLAVGAADPKAIDLVPQTKAQKITVDFTAGEEVLVLVMKDSDAKGEEGLMNADVNRAKALASKSGKADTFTADVPANTAVRVIVTAKKKTDVTLKLKN